jgi:DNA repair protein RadC
MGVKDWAKENQPYYKCLEHGQETLTDAELLAVLLKYGAKGKSCVELADEVMAVCGDKGIVSLGCATKEKLLSIKGMGESKTVTMLCISEIVNRYCREKIRSDKVMDDPSIIANYYMNEYRFYDQEVLSLICLDTKNKLIAKVNISKGGLNSSTFYIPDILKTALSYSAAGVVLMHNHPSGDPLPSKADISATLEFKKACDCIKIAMLDHIVLGDNCYFSMKEAHILDGE